MTVMQFGVCLAGGGCAAFVVGVLTLRDPKKFSPNPLVTDIDRVRATLFSAAMTTGGVIAICLSLYAFYDIVTAGGAHIKMPK